MKPAAAVFAALVSLGSAASCTTPTSSTVEDHLDSVVGVEARGCSLVAALGSGTILEPERVVTSAHTVAGAADISVIDATGDTLPATLVAFDPDTDLAVLSVPGLDAMPLPLGRAAAGASGWVLAWNRNDGVHAEPMTVTKRIRVTIEDIYIDDVVERGAIEIDAVVVPGDSGGAVISSRGEVIGLVYATSRSRSAGFALNDDEIRASLDAAVDDRVDAGPCI